MNRFWVLSLLTLLCASSCTVECRDVTTTLHDFECDVSTDFVGELHFDRAATFRTFLEDECLSPEDDRVSEWVQGIDFSQDALVFMRGSANLNDECLSSREVQSVQTCTSGLRVSFFDEVSGSETCSTPNWVVAFSLPRDELRAALDAEEDTL